MSVYKALDNAFAKLAGALNTTDVTAVVEIGKGALFEVGADYTYLDIENSAGNIERVKLTGRSGDSLTIVRAQGGTTARSWSVGDIIECRICSLAIESIKGGPGTGLTGAHTAYTAIASMDLNGITQSAWVDLYGGGDVFKITLTDKAYFLNCKGNPTLKNSSTLILPNSLDIPLTSGDLVLAYSDGSGITRVDYKSNGALSVTELVSMTQTAFDSFMSSSNNQARFNAGLTYYAAAYCINASAMDLVANNATARNLAVAHYNFMVEGITNASSTLKARFSLVSAAKTAFAGNTVLTGVSIPVMTSNTTPSGTVSALSYQVGYDPWRAFDNEPVGPGSWIAAGLVDQWLQYAFPQSFYPYAIRIIAAATSRAPKNCVFKRNVSGTLTDALNFQASSSVTTSQEFWVITNYGGDTWRLHITDVWSFDAQIAHLEILGFKP